MNIGENIYRLRTEKNLSQEDLANALEVSRQSVSKWETGSAVPEVEKLVKLSQLFGCTMERLCFGTDAPPAPQETEKRRRSPVLLLVCTITALLMGFLVGTLLPHITGKTSPTPTVTEGSSLADLRAVKVADCTMEGLTHENPQIEFLLSGLPEGTGVHLTVKDTTLDKSHTESVHQQADGYFQGSLALEQNHSFHVTLVLTSGTSTLYIPLFRNVTVDATGFGFQPVWNYQ